MLMTEYENDNKIPNKINLSIPMHARIVCINEGHGMKICEVNTS